MAIINAFLPKNNACFFINFIIPLLPFIVIIVIWILYGMLGFLKKVIEHFIIFRVESFESTCMYLGEFVLQISQSDDTIFLKQTVNIAFKGAKTLLCVHCQKHW